jgi:hypothetical protein
VCCALHAVSSLQNDFSPFTIIMHAYFRVMWQASLPWIAHTATHACDAAAARSSSRQSKPCTFTGFKWQTTQCSQPAHCMACFICKPYTPTPP